jgi:hypothetical protein
MAEPTIQPPGPGQGWICENGTRHFVCGYCEGLFTTDPGQTEDERRNEAQANLGEVPPPEDIVRVCDDCYPVLLARAQAKGLIP